MTAWSESKSLKNVGVFNERTFLHRHFSKRIDRIFKNCSCFIHYRLLRLCRILLNIYISKEDILHYLTAMTESNSFRISNLGFITERIFFHRHFLRELIEFLRIAHVLSTIDYWCFIGSFLTVEFRKRTYCTTWQRGQNQNLFKNVGVITELPFYIGIFLRELIEFLRIAHVSSTIDSWCFVGSF